MQAVRQLGRPQPDKPLKVLAFDEARFGLTRLAQEAIVSKGVSSALYCPACLQVDLPLCSTRAHSGREFLPTYLPGMDSKCLQSFLEGLCEAYPDHHLLVVLDGAPSHRSEEIICPDNVDFLRLPAYSPELDPVERWFQEFRRELSNKAFETVELLQQALGQALLPYWEEPARLRQLTGFSWWVEAVHAL
jgi:DDE superfamily endonuclease